MKNKLNEVVLIFLLMAFLIGCGNKTVEPDLENAEQTVVVNNVQETTVPAEDVTLAIELSPEQKTTNSKPEVYPNNAPHIIMDTVNAEAGETVRVNAYIKNNPGVLAALLTMSYDEENMTLTEVQSGDAFEGVLDFTPPGKLHSACNFVWDAVEIQPEQVRDGVILTLTFLINDNAPSGAYPIILLCSEDNVIDNDLNLLTMYIINGSIVVQQ